MIKYRKNENWNTVSFCSSTHNDIDGDIKIEMSKIKYEKSKEYIDIIDVNIRSVVSNVTYHYCTIFYALVPLNEIKIQI